MAYCSECGAEVRATEKFCSSCGHPLVAVERAMPIEADTAPLAEAAKLGFTLAYVAERVEQFIQEANKTSVWSVLSGRRAAGPAGELEAAFRVAAAHLREFALAAADAGLSDLAAQCVDLMVNGAQACRTIITYESIPAYDETVNECLDVIQKVYFQLQRLLR